MNSDSVRFPTRKKWLIQWWKKNINTFLYATENQEIQDRIKEFRERWLDGVVYKTTPEELLIAFKRLFLKEAEGKNSGRPVILGDSPTERVGDDYYVTHKDSKSGRETKWHLSNPFILFDNELLVPEWKMRIINALSNIHERKNAWVFDPKFSTGKDAIVYPSHISLDILHRLDFLRSLRHWVIGPLNVDYFVFWSMFLYYALTNNRDFVIKHTTPLIYPAQMYWLKDMDGFDDFLTLRFYGDPNFNEISNFMQENKKELSELNKLMGNQSVKARDIQAFERYIDSQRTEDIEIATKVVKKKYNDEGKSTGMNYEDRLRRKAIGSRAYRESASAKKAFRSEINALRSTRSKIKREIENVTDFSLHPPYHRIKELIDKINTPKL